MADVDEIVHAVDVEEGEKCPVCLDTLVLNDLILSQYDFHVSTSSAANAFNSCIGMV